MDKRATGLTSDTWTGLKAYTGARIALGRVGGSLPTRAHLAFQLAHARARDAVRLPLDVDALARRLDALGFKSLPVESQAIDRDDYLQHPDRGRRLSATSADRLRVGRPETPSDLALVVADGLSAIAIERHAVPLLQILEPRLKKMGLTRSPIVLVRQGRVAVADAVAVALGCRMAVILIGERPGLSSPDSMGIYFTFNPHAGCPDSLRNCISNIHAAGLDYPAAVDRLIYLIGEADRRKFSGVALKDESTPAVMLQPAKRGNFLLD